jgi:hypothetical protein
MLCCGAGEVDRSAARGVSALCANPDFVLNHVQPENRSSRTGRGLTAWRIGDVDEVNRSEVKVAGE